MTFLVVEPEASGRAADRAADGLITFVFDVWLGDDLVRAYPDVLVTKRLKAALEAVPNATGFRLSRVGVRRSRFFRLHNPGRRLPAFWAVEIPGRAGLDDMGLTDAGALVVSRRILDAFLDGRVGQAAFAQYTPGGQQRRLRSGTG